VVSEIISILRDVRTTLVSEDSNAAFRAYAALRLAPHKKRFFNDDMTTKAIAGATSEARDGAALLRPEIFVALAELAEDEATLVRAEQMTNAASLDHSLAVHAVALASRRADKSRFDELRAAIRDAKTPSDRTTALVALYSFSDPQILERAFDLILTDEVRAQDFIYILRGTRAFPETQKLAFDWTKAHWKELRAKMKGFLAIVLVDTAAGTCTDQLRADAQAFLATNASDIDGAARPIAERIEALSLCAALRARESANATGVLSKLATDRIKLP
jgi:ERAP1-like C-terminal domain